MKLDFGEKIENEIAIFLFPRRGKIGSGGSIEPKIPPKF